MSTSISCSQQCTSLQIRMKAMIKKIEDFNQFGTMDGATAIAAKHFTSMKQDILDLCDSRYDDKVKKCCEEQPIEEFDELQVRMKALVSKVKCYNKCVKIAKSDGASKKRKEKSKEKLPQILNCGNNIVVKENPSLKAAASSLASVTMDRDRHHQHAKHQHSSLMCSPIISAGKTKDSSKLRGSPEFREFPLSTMSEASSASYLVGVKQRDEIHRPSPPTGFNLRRDRHGYKQRSWRGSNASSSDDASLSQWNMDSDFLVTGSTHSKASSGKKQAERWSTMAASRGGSQPLRMSPKQQKARNHPGHKHTASVQARISPLSPLTHSRGGIDFESVKHSTPDWEYSNSQHHQETNHRRSVFEHYREQSSFTESDFDAVTPSITDTTQDETATCSSLTSYEQEQDRSLTTDSVENGTSAQGYYTSAAECATSNRTSATDSEDYSDPLPVPQISPNSGKNSSPVKCSKESDVHMNQDTLAESVLEEQGHRKSMAVACLATLDGNPTVGSVDCLRKLSLDHARAHATSVLQRNGRISCGLFREVVPDSYREQGPLKLDCDPSLEHGQSRNKSTSTGPGRSERISSNAPNDCPLNCTTEAAPEASSRSAVQTPYHVYSGGEYTTSSEDYSQKPSTEHGNAATIIPSDKEIASEEQSPVVFEECPVSMQTKSSSAVPTDTVVTAGAYGDSIVPSEDCPQNCAMEFEDYSYSTGRSPHYNDVYCDGQYASGQDSTKKSDGIVEYAVAVTATSAAYRNGTIYSPKECTSDTLASEDCARESASKKLNLFEAEETVIEAVPPEQSTLLPNTQQQDGYIECSLRAHGRPPSSSDEYSIDQCYSHGNPSSRGLPEDTSSSAVSMPLHQTEQKDCDFERSVYRRYHHLVSQSDLAGLEYSESGTYSPCKSKGSTKRSSLRTSLQTSNKHAGVLRKRSVSLKSVRFTDASSPPYHKDSAGYHHKTNATGCEASEMRIGSLKRQNSDQEYSNPSEYYPQEPPPVRHCISEYYADSYPNEVYTSRVEPTGKARPESYPNEVCRFREDPTGNTRPYCTSDFDVHYCTSGTQKTGPNHVGHYDDCGLEEQNLTHSIHKPSRSYTHSSDAIKSEHADFRGQDMIRNSQEMRWYNEDTLRYQEGKHELLSEECDVWDSHSARDCARELCDDQEIELSTEEVRLSTDQHQHKCRDTKKELHLLPSQAGGPPTEFEGVTNPPTESEGVSSNVAEAEAATSPPAEAATSPPAEAEAVTSPPTEAGAATSPLAGYSSPAFSDSMSCGEQITGPVNKSSKKRRGRRLKLHRRFLKGLTFNMQFPKMKFFCG